MARTSIQSEERLPLKTFHYKCESKRNIGRSRKDGQGYRNRNTMPEA